MNTEKDLLFTNAISTPMVYYVSYGEKPEEIEMKYGQIQKGTETDLKSFFEAGVVAMKNKNVSAAIGNFMKVVEMVPGFLPAVNNLGALYSSVGQLREAIYFFEEGIKKDPKNFQVRYNLGTLHCLNKNFNEAKGQLLQARSLFPNEPSLNNNLGLTLFGMDKDSHESKEIFSALTENNADFEIGFHNYGHILAVQKKYDEAVEYYQKALEKNPKSHITKNDLACAFYRQGKVKEALDLLFEIVKETEYSFQAAVYNIGYIVTHDDLLKS